MIARVLLLGDHDGVRTSLAQRLSRSHQVELVGAASGIDEAAAVLGRVCPDVVLLDIRQQNGLWVDWCARLPELTNAPLVALTSFVTPELSQAIERAGVKDYLFKHVDTERLGREIARLAERYRPEKAGRSA